MEALGAGYSDIETALLQEAGLMSRETAIVTTVRELQVVGESMPAADHDFSVDVVATPDELVRFGPPPQRPPGLGWWSATGD